MRFILAVFLSSLLLCSCQPSPSRSTSRLHFQMMKSPLTSSGGFPQLFSTGNRLYMSWLEEKEDSSCLKMAFLEGDTWSEEQVVASGKDWFVNWADFPEVFVGEQGTLYMHHLAKTGKGTYAYGVQVSQKSVDEEVFSLLGTPYTDTSETEHGFVSFFSIAEEGNAMLWLDGRKYATGNKEMSLRSAKIGKDGKFYAETEIDGRTCDCCQTDAVRTQSGAVVVFRDRSDEEIRDIYSSVYKKGAWSEPRAVANDNWKIDGCPVNGPALASQGDQVAVAWFTAANDSPKVKLAFSQDGGEYFDRPLSVDLGNPMGRVDIIWVDAEQVLVSWMERKGEKKAEVMVRQVSVNRDMEAPQAVGAMSAERATGFPVMVQHKDKIFLAWTLDKEIPEIALWSSPKR